MMKKIFFIMLFAFLTLNAKYTKQVQMPHISYSVIVDKEFPIMQRNCQWCHSFGYILNQGKQSREFWNHVVVRMREVYKAPISEKDDEILTNYLFRNYGNGKLK
jgi:hypothetical protein